MFLQIGVAGRVDGGAVMARCRICRHDLFDVGWQCVVEGIDAAGEADFIDEACADERRAMEHRREIDGVVIGEGLGHSMLLHDLGIAAGQYPRRQTARFCRVEFTGGRHVDQHKRSGGFESRRHDGLNAAQTAAADDQILSIPFGA